MARPDLLSAVRIHRRHAALVLAAALCGNAVAGPATGAGTTRADPAGGATTAYARLFDIEYRDGCTLLTIRLTPADGHPRRYLLVPRHARAPSLDGITATIPTPVRSVVVLSNAYLPFLEANGVIDRLRGVNQLSHVSSEAVRAAAARGEIVEVGHDASLDRERLLAIRPDLVLTYGDGQPPAALRPLQAAGITIVETAEYRESHPLGYAEWVRAFAAFFDTGPRADRAFAGVAERYQQARDRASGVAHRPVVLVGGSYHGVWYVPTPQSYTAQLIADAGGRYAFADLPWHRDSLETMLPIDLETALAHGGNANLWIDTLTWRSRAEALAADPRYRLFAPMRSGRMYNNDARTNADGANAFWEEGLARPDTVLNDLLQLLHPELGSGTLTWYRPLPDQAP